MNLEEYARQAQETPFQWGVNDCAMWAASWWELQRGEPLDLPRYESRQEADQKIAAAGGLVALIESQIGPSVQYGQPGQGDIAVIETKLGEMTAISLGNAYAVARTENGVRMFLALERVIKGFWPIQ